MRCMCANNSGISSTRSVSMFNVSFMLGVYYNFEISSRNERTVREYKLEKVKINYRDEENAYPVHSRTGGEIYCWAIGKGDPSQPYAFASISEPHMLYFTNDEQDPLYQDKKGYHPIR